MSRTQPVQEDSLTLRTRGAPQSKTTSRVAADSVTEPGIQDVPPPPDSESLWDTYRRPSTKNEPYRVIRLKGHRRGGDFDVNVNWEVNTSEITDLEFARTTGIVEYSLSDGGLEYTYRLTFKTMTDFIYFFVDASGDEYQVDVTKDGEQAFDFNSDKATIVRIYGTSGGFRTQ